LKGLMGTDSVVSPLFVGIYGSETMTKSTVLNRLTTGDKRVECWDINEYEGVWCLIKDGREYKIVHRMTGLALPNSHRIQRIAKERLAIIMDGVNAYHLNTGDVIKVTDAIGKDRKRAYDAACSMDEVDALIALDPYREARGMIKDHFGIPDDDGHDNVVVTVKQLHAPYATHEYTVTADDVINGDHCCGPCECHIEPDGVCGNGWPGTADALARC
jgi:hypothetical protein